MLFLLSSPRRASSKQGIPRTHLRICQRAASSLVWHWAHWGVSLHTSKNLATGLNSYSSLIFLLAGQQINTDKSYRLAKCQPNSLRSKQGVNLHGIESMAVILVFRGLSWVCEFEVCLDVGTSQKVSRGPPHAEVV